jgi:ABC-2 type transport system ATP-binding protein
MWDEIRRLKSEGMTIFLTTHYLDEADALCDRISIMDNGLVVAEGTPDELKREISGDTVLVGFDGQSELATKALRAEPFVNSLESTEDGLLRLNVEEGATAIPLILRALDGAGVPLRSIELHRPSLDDVFLTKTGRSLRES